MRDYLLKEYGSWSVLAFSYLTGLIASKTVDLRALFILLALSLLINTKQSFGKWIRQRELTNHLISFISQAIIATVVLLTLFGKDTLELLPYVVIPLAYTALLIFAGEHLIVTEIAGFATLTLSSLIAKFAVTGALDLRLYIVVALFFIAGVFKVRVQLKKGLLHRVVMVLYICMALSIFSFIDVSLIILIPLIENLIYSLTLYSVKLKVTGWLEVSKGLLFILLMAIFY
jgi:hypothetical protein